MWELNNDGSYYKWNGEELVGSIIRHEDFDGVHPNTYGVQIQTSDGELVAIGYIPVRHFNNVVAQAICDLALEENKDYAWWTENYYKWWRENVIYD